MPHTMRVRACVASVALSLTVIALPGPARADEPSASPTPTPTPTSTPAPDSTPTPDANPRPAPTPSETPSPTLTPTVSASPAVRANAAPGPTSLTLRVSSIGSPVAGQFYEDLGRFAISGGTSPAAASQRVQLYTYDYAQRAWIASSLVSTQSDGSYVLSRPVGAAGPASFQTRLLDAGGAVLATSAAVGVTVRDATVSLVRPATTIDAVRIPNLTGAVVPARAGVRVALDVSRSGRWSTSQTAVTGADGRFVVPFTYGQGQLARFTVRASYRAVNRVRIEASAAYAITRVKLLSPVITTTTRTDVARTYRSGCPVGPSKLSTIAINYYGFDRRMHRGVIIVRKDLGDDVIRGFGAALKANYPIAKMNNPNVYGGNDPTQMAANNTSGFNCRKVVGNPLRQSPHSYGIAIDVNTVQNPYRDVNGKWWPKNGKSYIDRSPHKRGMLTKKSALTKRLKKDKFFWGGLWNPGRDYQHYQRK